MSLLRNGSSETDQTNLIIVNNQSKVSTRTSLQRVPPSRWNEQQLFYLAQRPTSIEESDLVNGRTQQAVSLIEMMMMTYLYRLDSWRLRAKVWKHFLDSINVITDRPLRYRSSRFVSWTKFWWKRDHSVSIISCALEKRISKFETTFSQ